jgi:hypothetical protein
VEVFSKRMGEILESQENALCLVDDVLVFGKDQAEHDARLREVLDRFRRAKVTLNEKCEFSKNQIKWAGHVISGDGISMDPDRLSAILNMPPPTDVSAARCFLRMANQMAKFSSSLAELSAPTRDLLRKDRAWVWDSAQQSAFEKVKKGDSVSARLSAVRPEQTDARVSRQLVIRHRRRAASATIGQNMAAGHLRVTCAERRREAIRSGGERMPRTDVLCSKTIRLPHRNKIRTADGSQAAGVATVTAACARRHTTAYSTHAHTTDAFRLHSGIFARQSAVYGGYAIEISASG